MACQLSPTVSSRSCAFPVHSCPAARSPSQKVDPVLYPLGASHCSRLHTCVTCLPQASACLSHVLSLGPPLQRHPPRDTCRAPGAGSTSRSDTAWLCLLHSPSWFVATVSFMIYIGLLPSGCHCAEGRDLSVLFLDCPHGGRHTVGTG